MRAASLLLLPLTGLFLLGQEGPPRTYRQWLGDQEAGGSTLELRQEGRVREVRSREWMVLARMGQELRQELTQTARQAPDGSLAFTWRLQLSSEPYEGRAEWSPREPGILSINPAHGPSSRKEIPPKALLWPEDLEALLKEAAREGRSLQATTFSFPVLQWSTLRLEPQGKAPLPGFPDAVRFTGVESQGATISPVEVWVSPMAGELRHQTVLGGLRVLTQRSELPAPAPSKGSPEGFFEQTLQKLPPHPFLPWIPDLTLRAEGPPPDLPEDAQQTRLPQGRWRLRQAASPTRAEAAQPPVRGRPSIEEAQYLSPSPLVPFQDPAFDGLIHRMALPRGLSRWELARRVTTFVFDWITEKDFTVGFASALEVCRQPRGDCTEHGVLAVALLRRLGVPARGVTGWVGLGETLGLHFWVEVRLKERWVPVDPTFDQAPASALRIKLGHTDLADLGSVGWDTGALAFSGVRWIPEKEGNQPFGQGVSLRGDQVLGAGQALLRCPGGRWTLRDGRLQLHGMRGGPWPVQAVTRPGEAPLKGARRLAGAQTLRPGWWSPSLRCLWMEVAEGRWLEIGDVSETEAFDLLDQLQASANAS